MLKHFIYKFAKCTWHERFLLVEALWQLGNARLLVIHRPFNRIAPTLGDQGHLASTDLTAQQISSADMIGWAVRATARRTPWNSNCLAQAVAAKRMLQRRELPSTLFLGVQKSKEDPDNLNAHAWVTCGEMILTGKRHYQDFKIVSEFGDKTTLQGNHQ